LKFLPRPHTIKRRCCSCEADQDEAIFAIPSIDSLFRVGGGLCARSKYSSKSCRPYTHIVSLESSCRRLNVISNLSSPIHLMADHASQLRALHIERLEEDLYEPACLQEWGKGGEISTSWTQNFRPAVSCFPARGSAGRRNVLPDWKIRVEQADT
jgi:hypothetical protein